MQLPAVTPASAEGSAEVASPAPEVRVRPARPTDLVRTARVHRWALPDGFFARLGTAFLRRYHATFVTSPRATLLVAEDADHEVVGFLAGTVDNAAHYRNVVQRRPLGLVLSGVAALLREPRLAGEFLRTRTLRYARALLRALAGGRTRVAASEGPRRVAVLTHVAVTDGARGLGAGRALVADFTRRAREARADELRLVTRAGGAAAGFYRRLGWTSRGTRTASDGTFVEEFARRP